MKRRFALILLKWLSCCSIQVSCFGSRTRISMFHHGSTDQENSCAMSAVRQWDTGKRPLKYTNNFQAITSYQPWTRPKRKKLWIGLSARAADSQDDSSSANRQERIATSVILPRPSNDEDPFANFPWSDIQSWTLRDQLPRYSIQVPVTDPQTQQTTVQVYALWRSLINEVPELAGYPIPFLIQKHQELQKKTTKDVPVSDEKPTYLPQTPTTVLPYLDEFSFTTSGGLSGRVYGVVGVADGTRIETTPVGSVEVTIPKGFVTTHDGLLYELGRPSREPNQEIFSWSNGGGRAAIVPDAIQSTNGASRSNLEARGGLDRAWDPELVQFGVLTALVIGGAVAFESLQHHLTVNVFWV